jgi:hypothetical protein
MEPTRINEKRLTPEKPSSHYASSNDPPAYSDSLNTTTNSSDDEQLLARLGYKQVSGILHILQLDLALTHIRSFAASSTSGQQYHTPSQY